MAMRLTVIPFVWVRVFRFAGCVASDATIPPKENWKNNHNFELIIPLIELNIDRLAVELPELRMDPLAWNQGKAHQSIAHRPPPGITPCTASLPC
jgi:hypothetical protein